MKYAPLLMKSWVAPLALIGFLLFLVAFVMILIQVLHPKNKPVLAKGATLPLANDTTETSYER